MTTIATEFDHDHLVMTLSRYLEAQTGQTAHIIETHISSVILCGDFAYKLKRPVKLAFLNAGLALPATGTACELGFGQGVSANIHAAASLTQ